MYSCSRDNQCCHAVHKGGTREPRSAVGLTACILSTPFERGYLFHGERPPLNHHPQCSNHVPRCFIDTTAKQRFTFTCSQYDSSKFTRHRGFAKTLNVGAQEPVPVLLYKRGLDGDDGGLTLYLRNTMTTPRMVLRKRKGDSSVGLTRSYQTRTGTVIHITIPVFGGAQRKRAGHQGVREPEEHTSSFAITHARENEENFASFVLAVALQFTHLGRPASPNTSCSESIINIRSSTIALLFPK